MVAIMIDDELSNIFSNVANAIRRKGITGSFTPYQFSNKIDEIETGLQAPYQLIDERLKPVNNCVIDFAGVKRINDNVLRNRFWNVGTTSDLPRLSVNFPDLSFVCYYGMCEAYKKNKMLAVVDMGDNEINVAYNAAYHSLDNTFADCVNLSSVKMMIGPNTSYSCAGMISGCTGLIDASSLSINLTSRYADEYAYFQFCNKNTKMKSPPTIITGGKEALTYSFYQAYNGCTLLLSCCDLNFGTIGDRAFYLTFNGCTKLLNVGGNLGSKIGNYGCYYMFGNCSALTATPDLPAKSVNTYGYAYMFYNCVGLSTAPVMSVESISTYSMRYMFAGCTKLSGDIYLPLSSATANAMQYMCNKIPNDLTLHFKPAFQSTLTSMTGYPKFGATGNVTIVYDM